MSPLSDPRSADRARASTRALGSAELRERAEVGGHALVIGRGEITLP